jgi:iron(III) transport system substrate-binding protein
MNSIKGRWPAGLVSLALTLAAACSPAQSAAPAATTAPAATAGSAAAAGGDTATTGDAAWQQIVEAGKKEGKIVIYGTFEQSLQDKYIPEFNKVYPFITVEVVYGSGPESAEKIRAETAAGKLVADIWRSNTDPALALRDQGLLEQYQTPSLLKDRDKFAYQASDEDGQGYLNNLAASVQGIMVNTKQIKPEDEPKSWFDLKDPKYKGKIIYADPRLPNSGQSIAWFISQKYGQEGQDFLRALGTQDLQFEVAQPKIVEEIARGERPIGAPVSWTSYKAVEGPDVKFIQPKEGLYYSIVNAVIPKGAPHPNAAKLWIEWEDSQAGQQVKADVGQETALRTDVKAQQTWLRLDTAGPWASVTFEDRRTKQAEMGQTVKSYFSS